MNRLTRFLACTLTLFLSALPIMAQVTTGYVRVGVVLPLKEKSPRGAKMVEFYQGLLMAADSVRRQGCSIDIVALHSGNTAAAMDSLIATRQLVNLDIVFGPLDAAQLPALADYCDLHGTRLVVPFTSISTHVEGHPKHYLVNAPRSIVQREAAWFIQNLFPEENVVIVDCGEQNDEGAALVERVRMAMDERGVYVQQVKVDDSDEAYNHALALEKNNILVLNSSSLQAINALRNRLRDYLAAHTHLHISLFGYPAWQSYASQMLSDFYQFDTYIYTPFYRDPNEPLTLQLEQKFQDFCRWPIAPTFPRYGLLGFDLGYYFLHGIARYGKLFEANLVAVDTKPFQNPLRFVNQGDGNGHINTFVEIVHYTNYQAVEILYRNQ
ncbi:MAG: hypothetical protein IJK15_11130 [Bacteroidaceae bacterium]|nr:hypothetical protein [Bacteroidaceae bacterium]